MALRFRILPCILPVSASARATAAAEPGDPPGPVEERAFEIAIDLDEVRLGRQPGVEIELPFAAVSTVHARITRGQAPGDWWIEDLGSTNGTWLNGARLVAGRPTPLRGGQRLRVATVDLVFDGWSAVAAGSEGTGSMARRLISDLFGVVGGDVPALVVEAGGAHPARLPLGERERRYRAGRGEDCDLVLPSEAVSREHAVFVRRWDGVTVADLGSRNGVLVNGAPAEETSAPSAERQRERRLADGDLVTMGPVTVRLADPEDRYLRRLRELADGSAPRATARNGRSTDPRPARPTPLASQSLVSGTPSQVRTGRRDLHSGASSSRRWLAAAALVLAVAAIVALAVLLLAT